MRNYYSCTSRYRDTFGIIVRGKKKDRRPVALLPLIDVEREGDLARWKNFFYMPANDTTNV